MTRKHYKMIAKIMYEQKYCFASNEAFERVVRRMASDFKDANMSFNIEKFVEACGV